VRVVFDGSFVSSFVYFFSSFLISFVLLIFSDA